MRGITIVILSRLGKTDGDDGGGPLAQKGVFSFSSGILVCTDVMARGIDIPEVNWVLQYDPPSSARYGVMECDPLCQESGPMNPEEDTHNDVHQNIALNNKNG